LTIVVELERLTITAGCARRDAIEFNVTAVTIREAHGNQAEVEVQP
jgi:hypothetical protein